MRGLKIGVTKWFRQNTSIYTVWQRNYYEHVIRNERALYAIRQYIIDNPPRWHLDRYNPDATAPDLFALDLWRMLREDAIETPAGGRRHRSPTKRHASTSGWHDQEATP